MSPQAVVNALESYEHPTGGPNDLRKYAPMARSEWDFTREDTPPFKIFSRMGANDYERREILSRLRSVANVAVNGRREIRLAS